MKLRQGNMFDHAKEYDVILVTTNAIVRKDGALVMGRGAALEASKRFPSLPSALGEYIKDRPEYGIIIPALIRDDWSVGIGAFQVKRHWRDPADLNLISLSAWKLNVLARSLPSMKFALNFPGIGNGRLERDDVLPQITILPDNVDVWEL